MAFQLSPGVKVSEIDLTSVVPSVASSIGAFAGKFNWGPVNEVVTITDEIRLAERFGLPDNNNAEYWFSAANFLAYSNNLKVVRAANTSSTLNATANGSGVLISNSTEYEESYSTGANTYGTFAAKYAGSLGNSIRVEMADANTFNAVRTTISASALVVDTLYKIETSGNTNWTSIGASSNTVGTTFTANGVGSGTGTASYESEPVWAYADEFTDTPSTSAFASSVGGANDEVHVLVIDVNGKFSNGVANTVLEKYSFLSKASDAKTENGSTNYYKNVLNNRSRYIWWMSHPDGTSNWGNAASNTSFSVMASRVAKTFSGGANGTITDGNIQTAYSTVANSDSTDVSLIIAGPANATIANHLTENIAEVRKDVLVFISPEKSDVVDNYGSELTDVKSFRASLTSTSYGVMDTGWKYQYDKYNDVYRWIPLNGDIAGLCARTDYERDPWFSPAGINRGIIKNVVKLAWSPSKAERDDLYLKGINPVVSFPGEGTLLFGDKTLLSRPSAFDRINVRRLFIVLEKAIATAARSTLFEFNDQFTRAQFVNLVEPYLRDVQGRRGITDFRVVCDERNNTPEVIDRNEFVGDIYIKPTRSANFIQLNFVAVRSGVSFDEIVGRQI